MSGRALSKQTAMATQSSLDLAKANYLDACRALLTVEMALNQFRCLVRDFAEPLKGFLSDEDDFSGSSLSHLSQGLTFRLRDISRTLREITSHVNITRRAIGQCLSNLCSADANCETHKQLRSFCDLVISGVTEVERTVTQVASNIEAEANSIMELALQLDLPDDVVDAAQELLERVASKDSNPRLN